MARPGVGDPGPGAVLTGCNGGARVFTTDRKEKPANGLPTAAGAAMNPFRFYLGTHRPRWLGTAGVPLFVSRRTLCHGIPPRAMAPWALDSGGFSELTLFGRWRTTPRQYADEVARWSESVGRLAWAAIQDFMCEPAVLARTRLTIREHQKRTVASYLLLCRLAPEMPWAPVLQGWRPEDYLRHVEDYQDADVRLTLCPVVGLGSVCRRQNTTTAEDLIRELSDMGIRLHAFGFKVLGLARAARYLASSDSLAWSLQARRSGPLAGCVGHRNCANCLRYALVWRTRVLRAAAASTNGMEQRLLFGSNRHEQGLVADEREVGTGGGHAGAADRQSVALDARQRE